MNDEQNHEFVYRGWRFVYSARRMGTGVYRWVHDRTGDGQGQL
jgi:hypothetical protein